MLHAPLVRADVVWEVCVGEEPEVMGDGVFIILAPYLERKAVRISQNHHRTPLF